MDDIKMNYLLISNASQNKAKHQTILENVFAELKKLTFKFIGTGETGSPNIYDRINIIKDTEFFQRFVNRTTDLIEKRRHRILRFKESHDEIVSIEKNIVYNETRKFIRNVRRFPKVSKCEFLNNLKLCSKSPLSIDKNDKKSTRNSHSFVYNVPLSSDVGVKLYSDSTINEEYKLRKIDRLERYVNNRHIPIIKPIEYPVTYKKRSRKCSQKSDTVCRPVKVVLKKINLNKPTSINRMNLNLRDVRVVVSAAERQIVDNQCRPNRKATAKTKAYRKKLRVLKV